MSKYCGFQVTSLISALQSHYIKEGSESKNDKGAINISITINNNIDKLKQPAIVFI